MLSKARFHLSCGEWQFSSSPSTQIKFSPLNAPSDPASPARRALRESRRRPSGRFIAFPGKISSRFHGLFRLPFVCVSTGHVVHDFYGAPATFLLLLLPPFPLPLPLRSLARVSSSAETRYSRNFWHFSRRGTTLSQYSPVLCPFFLPSFLSSLLPSVVSTPLQRVSRHDFSRRRADFFRRTLLSSLSSRPVALNGINLCSARFKKTRSHNSVMRTRPWLIPYLWFIGLNVKENIWLYLYVCVFTHKIELLFIF